MKPDKEYHKDLVLRKKATAEEYVLGSPKEWIATIFLDDLSGTIAVKSDYGTWAFSWPYPGRGDKTLKEFLLGAGLDYVSTKFSYGTDSFFYFDESVDEIKMDILKARYKRKLNTEQARVMWDQIDDFRSDYGPMREPTLFVSSMVEECPTIFKLLYGEDYTEVPCRTGKHPRLIAFMEKVWPHFLDILRQEVGEIKKGA